MEITMYLNQLRSRWVVGLVGLLSVLLVACGTAAPPTPEPTANVQAVQPIPESSPPGGSVPTTTPSPSPALPPVAEARDSIVLVVQQEPDALNAFSDACTASPDVFPCGDYSTDTLTYIVAGAN
jgi:hypothetical protein